MSVCNQTEKRNLILFSTSIKNNRL